MSEEPIPTEKPSPVELTLWRKMFESDPAFRPLPDVKNRTEVDRIEVSRQGSLRFVSVFADPKWWGFTPGDFYRVGDTTYYAENIRDARRVARIFIWAFGLRMPSE